jgi:Fe2+ transport system protein FeoA
MNKAQVSSSQDSLDRKRQLHELPPGGHGVVHAVRGSDAALLRLMAMGLCVGREVEVIRQGNPLIVRLLGARVGVSERLAQNVVIERCKCAKCRSEIEELSSVA